MLLSMVDRSVPMLADLCQLSWLYDIGYKKMMLCDELCLTEERLGRAVNAFSAFRGAYVHEKPTPPPIPKTVPMDLYRRPELPYLGGNRREPTVHS